MRIPALVLAALVAGGIVFAQEAPNQEREFLSRVRRLTVDGKRAGEGKLELAKESVQVTKVEPVGVYAVRLHFDDGHDTGLYSWDYLRELGAEYDRKWARYLERCEKLGYERKASA